MGYEMLNHELFKHGTFYYEIRNGRKYYRAQVLVGVEYDGTPIRESKGSYDPSIVMSWLLDINKKIEAGELKVSDDGVPRMLGAFHLWWIDNIKKLQVGANTYSKYKTDYRLRLSPNPISKIAIQKITISDLQKYANYLLNSNSNTVVRNSINYISQSLEYARNKNLITANPANEVIIPKDEIKSTSPPVFSRNETKLIIEKLDTTRPVDMLIYFDFGTGLRRGELLSLEWSNIKNQKVHVVDQLQSLYIYENDKRKLVNKITDVKTANSIRAVPIPDAVYSALMEYKENQSKYIKMFGGDYENKNILFNSPSGDYMYINSPYRRLQNILKQQNLKPRPIHAIRHSYCTRLFEQGVPPKVVQLLAGHAKIETTLNLYTHVYDADRVTAVNSINEIIKQ